MSYQQSVKKISVRTWLKWWLPVQHLAQAMRYKDPEQWLVATFGPLANTISRPLLQGPFPAKAIYSVFTPYTPATIAVYLSTHFSARHDWQENTEWTASERQKAQQGITVGNVEELDTLVAILIPSCISYCWQQALARIFLSGREKGVGR